MLWNRIDGGRRIISDSKVHGANMWPTWVLCQPQMGPMLVPWTLLSGILPDGGRDGLWWPALSAHGWSCTGYLHLSCVWYDQCLGYCFYIYSPPLDVSAHEHSVLNNGLDNIQWVCFISDLHTKLRTISRMVPGFATGSPSGIWGRELTICLLYDGPLLGLCFFKWHLVCNFGIGERIFVSITCLSVFVHYRSFFLLFFLYIFLLWNNVYFMLSTLYYHIPDLLTGQSSYCGVINTLKPRQNGRRFTDDTFKRIFFNENARI